MTLRTLGKKKFKELELEDFIVKPEGAPTLVPIDDRRPAISFASAEDRFAEFAESSEEPNED